jgi:hypothetical protein
LWTANRRIYVDAFGNVVHERDPSRRTLLCPRGGQIPYATALELGLVEEKQKPAPDIAPTAAPEPEPEVKHVRRPRSAKHIPGPQETK